MIPLLVETEAGARRWIACSSWTATEDVQIRGLSGARWLNPGAGESRSFRHRPRARRGWPPPDDVIPERRRHPMRCAIGSPNCMSSIGHWRDHPARQARDLSFPASRDECSVSVYARHISSRRIGRWPPRKCGSTLPHTQPETLIFEQPLGGRMRTFLRLDFLYTQALYHNEVTEPVGQPRCHVLPLQHPCDQHPRRHPLGCAEGAGEAASPSLNEFQIEARRGCGGRLKTVLGNLVRLRGELLLNAGSAFLQPLRDSKFLSAIKHQSAIPGGTCEFDLPDYHYWLSQPDSTRGSRPSMNGWGCCGPLCDAIAELLWLTRANGGRRGRKWRRPGPSTSRSTGIRRFSFCGSRCPKRRGSTRRSAGVITAAACDSLHGMGLPRGLLRVGVMCRLFSARALERGAGSAL